VGRGVIARWQWGRWERVESPTTAPLSFVTAEGDEALAATFAGELFEGSPHGWRALARCPGNLYGLATWRGQTVVATRPDGLFAVEGDRVAPLHATVNAGCLHAGGALLWTCASGLVGTLDFKVFEEVMGPELGAALGGEYWSE
jgi:hypothetical protein